MHNEPEPKTPCDACQHWLFNKSFLVQVRKLALSKKTPVKRERMELAKSIDEQRAKSHIMYQDICNASDKMLGNKVR